MIATKWANHRSWPVLSTTYLARKASRLAFLVLCGLVLVPVSSPGQTAAETNQPNVLQEISDAVARIAEQTTPAVVGIWVDIKSPATQTSSKNAPRQPGSQEEGQSTEASEQILHKYIMPYRSRNLGTTLKGQVPHWPPQVTARDQKQPPSKEAPSDQFPQLQQHKLALGSGFIVSPDGYILTNNHVVGNADLVLVIVGDNEPVKAEVVGTDPDTDLAVIKVKGPDNLPVLPLADSDKLKVGDWVVAIGQPFGLSHTVTSGIISALGRNNMDLSTYEDFIQTDAPINPGNSGGPLLNLHGQVIGVNTAIVGSGGNIGIGFAIPVNMVKYVYEQIRKNGKVVRGFLGVSMQDLTPELTAVFHVPADTKGVIISHVAEDSPGAAAGLKPGDVLLQFDSKPIAGATAFRTQVSMLPPGSRIPIVLLRDGTRQDLTLVMGTRPAKAPSAKQVPTLEALGMAVQDLTADVAQRLNYQGQAGVVVVAVADDSPADGADITTGMLIQEVNRRPIANLSEFKTALEQAAEKPPILFLVNSQGAYSFVVITPPEKSQ